MAKFRLGETQSMESWAWTCYNSAMEIFYNLTSVFAILLSIVAFVFVLTWKRQRGQFLMLAFIAIGYILPQLINFALNIVAAYGMFADYNNFWIYSLIASVSGICNMIGTGLLMGYVAYLSLSNPKPNTRFPGSVNDESHPYLQSGEANSAAVAFGPQWNVPPDPKLNVKILRQREWGFVIDFLPFLVVGVAAISIITSRFGTVGFSNEPLETLMWGIFWLVVILQFFYALFRDCIGGRSFGKHFSGCRMVDFKTGKPAAVGQSIIRNLPFLIPLFSIVELAVASIRPDSRRLGDLMAGTIAVTGPPNFIDGEPVEVPEADLHEPVKKHPLDD